MLWALRRPLPRWKLTTLSIRYQRQPMNTRKNETTKNYPVMVPLGYSITEIVQWLDGFPIIAHLQYLNSEHVCGNTFPVKLPTKADDGVEKVLGVS